MARYLLLNNITYRGFEIKAAKEIDDSQADIVELTSVGAILATLPNPMLEARAVHVRHQQAKGRRDDEIQSLVASYAESVLGLAGVVQPGSVMYAKLSAEPLSAQRVMRSTDATHVDYCDAWSAGHLDVLLGISTNSTSGAEQPINVISFGDMTEPSWSWTSGAPIFCGLNGMLTQTFDPTWIWCRKVAYATSPTTIVVQLREPISMN